MATQKEIPCRILFCPHLASPFAREILFGAQNDKHSDWKIDDLDTVMAVAADSHRDFLIPERRRQAARPTTGACPDELCVFFFVFVQTVFEKRFNALPRKGKRPCTAQKARADPSTIDSDTRADRRLPHPPQVPASLQYRGLGKDGTPG